MKLFKEKRQLVICVAVVLLIAGFVLLRYLPLHRKTAGLKQIKETQTSIILKSQEQYQQSAKLQEKLLMLQQQVRHFDIQIPPQRQLGEFLQVTTELMKRHNLKDQIIQPGEEIKTEKLNCIPITMQGKGNLMQIFEFYKSLQHSDRLIRIEQVRLTREGDSGNDVIMDTKAVIYYRSQPEQG